MAEQYSNNTSTTLSGNGGSITSGATTLNVGSASGFPSIGSSVISGSNQFRILIDSEIMIVTAVSSNTFTVLRGQESTTAVSHLDGAAVTQLLTAGGLANLLISPPRLLSIDSNDLLVFRMSDAANSGNSASNTQSGTTSQITGAIGVTSAAVGWTVVITDSVHTANNGTYTITAASAGTFSYTNSGGASSTGTVTWAFTLGPTFVSTATATPYTGSGSGATNTQSSNTSVITGATGVTASAQGQLVTITDGTNAANNGTFQIWAAGSGTFSYTNSTPGVNSTTISWVITAVAGSGATNTQSSTTSQITGATGMAANLSGNVVTITDGSHAANNGTYPITSASTSSGGSFNYTNPNGVNSTTISWTVGSSLAVHNNVRLSSPTDFGPAPYWDGGGISSTRDYTTGASMFCPSTACTMSCWVYILSFPNAENFYWNVFSRTYRGTGSWSSPFQCIGIYGNPTLTNSFNVPGSFGPWACNISLGTNGSSPTLQSLLVNDHRYCLMPGKWFHVGWTWDSATNLLLAYMNGVNVGSMATTGSVIDSDSLAGYYLLGSSPDPGNAEFPQAFILDARVGTIARPASYFQTAYQTGIRLQSA